MDLSSEAPAADPNADPTSPSEPAPEVVAPVWCDLLVLGSASALGVTGLVGLLLAVVGAYRTWLALVLAVLPTVALIGLAARSRLAGPGAAGPGAGAPPAWARQAGAVAAVVVAGGFVAFAGWAPSQHVLLDRDPSSYQSTGLWLADHGDLEADVLTGGLEAAPDDLLRLEGPAVYEMPGGHLEFQFNHLASVVFAMAADIGGPRLMLRVPALACGLALLALYCVSVRAVRRPLLAVLPPTVMAVGLPLLYVARDTYSEPLAIALLWAAVLALVDVVRRPTVGMGVIGGVLLGATVGVRADSLLYVMLFFPIAALAVLAARGGERIRRMRAYGAAVAAVALTVPVGLVDLSLRSGRYVADVADQVALMRTGSIVSAVMSLLVVVLVATGRLSSIERWWRPLPVGAAAAVGSAVVVLLLAGWLLRPLVQVAETSVDYGIDRIQRRDGLEIEPARSYAEHSLVWVSWYLGIPGLAASIAGCGIAAFRVLRWRARPTLYPLLALGLLTGILYWWDPVITPDQPWASRRFVTAVLPSLAVLAVLGVAAGLRRLDRPALRRSMASVAAVALVVPPLVTMWPLRQLAVQRGYGTVVAGACELLGADATVLVGGAYEQLTLQHTLRTWCDLPVAGVGDLTGEDLVPIARAAEAQGRQLKIVAADSSRLTSLGFPGTVSPVSSTVVAYDRWTPERTLDRPSDEYVDESVVLPDEIPTPFQLHVVSLLSPSG